MRQAGNSSTTGQSRSDRLSRAPQPQPGRAFAQPNTTQPFQTNGNATCFQNPLGT
jgi:hypothetical protein